MWGCCHGRIQVANKRDIKPIERENALLFSYKMSSAANTGDANLLYPHLTESKTILQIYFSICIPY